MSWLSSNVFVIVCVSENLRLRNLNGHITMGLIVSIVDIILFKSNFDHVSDAKLRGHTETSVKHRDPTITKLTREYNELCRQLGLSIRQKKAPAGAIQPQEIPREGLFKLDVDDEIWQDVGLDDDHYAEMPLWLSDEGVRQGIRSLLELDQCEEEKLRLQQERCALQEWLLEEWEVNQQALNAAGIVYN